MQLAKIQRDGRLVLLPDALKHLRGLGKGILVVAVFGGARSAKSTTANMLLGKQSFGMSNTTDACTFGVWIDSRPHEDGKTLLVVDSEGMGKGDTTQHSKILGLVSLLASDGGVLIDNEMKDLGEHNLGTLGVLATMNQMLRGAQKYSWPALVVLLRDFTLTLKIGRRNATPMQYLHHVLEDPGERIDETRRLIRECFQHQNLFTFPPPTEQEHLSMMNLPPGQFKNTFEAMKAYLFECLTSKTIMEEECDGEKLVDLLETCLEGLNKDTGVDIPSAHEVVVERFCRRLIAQLETKYSEDLPKSALTGDEAKLIAQHNSVQTKLLESFDSETTGFATDRVGQCRDDLVARLSKAHQLLVAENKLLEQKQKQEEALKAHQEQLKAQQEQILKAQQEQNKRNEENNDILERLDSAPRRSPNFMTRPFNKPMTYTSLPLHPEAAQVISDLMVAGDKLRERVEEIEYKQRKQNRLSPTPSSFLPSSPSHPGFVAPQMVIPAPPSQVFMHAPQVVTPSPQFVTPSPQFVTPSPHFMHAPQVAPQMMVQQPSAPPQPVVVVVSSPPSSPQPQPEAHYDPPRQSSSFQLPPTRYQRRLSNNNNADAHAGAGNASANAGQNAGSAGSAGANAGGYAGNAGTAGRISPVFDSVHRVAR